MIKVKHLLDRVEEDDGQRIWVEPIVLVRDLREWCKIDHVLPHLGPPKALWQWYEEHPEGYEYFRARYHEVLARSPYNAALRQMAKAAQRETFTLVHQNERPDQNSATALHEFLSELEAWSQAE